MGLMMLGRLKHSEPRLWHEPSAIKVHNITEKLEMYESLGTDEITAELIQLVGRMGCSEVHKLTKSVRNKEELPEQ
jgi:hypothetical protein